MKYSHCTQLSIAFIIYSAHARASECLQCTGLLHGYRGGGRGWAPGLRGPGPWWLWAGAGETRRAHGLRLVRGGRGRAGRARGRTPRGPRGLGEGSRGRPFLEGDGGCSLPGGRRGPLLSEGGGGRVSPDVGPCRFMAARHGTIYPSLRAGVPFFGRAEGGRGGRAVMECTFPCGGGGLPVGALSGLAV